jgi:choline-sulfatase
MASDAAPNLLVIMSDQHSMHYLGCYGHSLVRTPHLDHLAAEGMRFVNAYCPAPLCVPSRMSFMTGRRPTANRVWSNTHILSSAIPTWAHALGIAGYDTALIGRMHFVGSDQRHGFQERPLGEYGAGFPGSPRLGAPLMRDIPVSTSGQCRESVEIAGRGRTTYQAFDEMVAEATCNYLQERARASHQRPFAAVAGMVLPHCPFVAPRELFDFYYPRVDVPEVSNEELPAAARRFQELRGIAEPLPDERTRVARAAYVGLCEHLDAQVGRILAALDATGLAESTLVIYCSDHGEMAGEHGCWWKSCYYEGSVGIPLIARWPDIVPSGAVSDTICNLLDLAPTWIEMANQHQMPCPSLPESDGHSLWRVLCGQADDSRPDETYAEHMGGIDTAPSRMIRSGRWKLFQYADDTPTALFDLEADPDETHDLGQDPSHALLRDGLQERLWCGWDPSYVRAESHKLDRDLEVLQQWGRTTQPPHPYTLPVPDVEEIELI